MKTKLLLVASSVTAFAASFAVGLLLAPPVQAAGNPGPNEVQQQAQTPSDSDMAARKKTICGNRKGDARKACEAGFSAASDLKKSTLPNIVESSHKRACDNSYSDEYLQGQCHIGFMGAANGNFSVPDSIKNWKSGGLHTAVEIDSANEICKDAGNDVKKAQCRTAAYKGQEGQQDGKSKSDACKGVASDVKQYCEKSFADSEARENKDKEVDCDTKWNSPLSWIVCPLIDMGVGVTDFIFKDFVQPMLENVPVSTEPDSGTFKAWQQFRLLANIALIASLLAIVYSQAKGGGGK